MKSIFTFCVLFLFLPITAFAQQQTGLLTISEVMFYGLTGSNEYVEIFNLSYDKSFDLTNFSIRYYNSLPDTIISAGKGLLLDPRSYAVVFEGDYDFSSGIYTKSIPPEALVLKIDNNAFGTSGMANTTDRTVCLTGPGSDTVDTYTYSADNQPGFSDEKIILSGRGNTSNWANSLLQGGTPGFKNSVTPEDYDLDLSSIIINPSLPEQDKIITLTLIVKNPGLKAAGSFQAEVFNNLNFDSVLSASEKIYSGSASYPSPGDSVLITFQTAGLPAGSYEITAVIDFEEDENQSNNKRTVHLAVSSAPFRYNDLVINEIMFAPSSGEPEWVELFNRSLSTVNLRKWEISDNLTRVYLTQKDFLVKPGDFIIVSKDTSIRKFYEVPCRILSCGSMPVLNNSGDRIVFKDSSGIVIDSLDYAAPYGSGRSLERVDPLASSTDAANWKVSLSAFKATPGKANSVIRPDYDLALSEAGFVPEDPSAGNIISVYAHVNNIGRSRMDFRLQLYEDTDRDSAADLMLSESGILSLEHQDSLLYRFDYSAVLKNERSFEIRIFAEKDSNPVNNVLQRSIIPSYAYNTLAVNEIMYMPEAPEPEWVEIFNSSPDSVNLKNWSVSDILASPAAVSISRKDEFLKSGSFIVLSKDSLIHLLHRNIPSKVIYCSIPPLNNDKDGIVLRDAKGEVIDSVMYEAAQGVRTGYSLERKYISQPSASKDNWDLSRSAERSTPGQINSITPKDYDLAAEEISILPEQPLYGGTVSLRVKLINRGLNDAENFSVKLSGRSYNSPVYNSLGEYQALSLKKRDSLTINFNDCIKELKAGGVYAAALISYGLDKDTTNNFLETLIEPGYSREALLINEVMFAPSDGEPEWLELVNVSSDTINLKGWQISDLIPSPSKAKVTSRDVFIYPGEFIIAARDSSFFKAHGSLKSKIFIVPFGSLSNSADGAAVYDLKGRVIDSLMFRGTWGGKKYSSIERLSFESPTNDSTNWMPSSDAGGSTPGSPNSVTGLHSYAGSSVIINEIMYEPDKDNCEYIELYNAGSEPIDLANWRILNEDGNSFYITDGSFTLKKGGYFIVSAGSALFNKYSWVKDSTDYSLKNLSSLELSNFNGLVLLEDAFKNTIDSVYYFSTWHSKSIPVTRDRSLERINPLLSSNNPANWRTCVSKEGGTPGRLNSIFVLNQKKESRFSVLPNPFSPDDDGFEDFTIINYNLSEGINSVVLKVFDSGGRLVRTITPGGLGSRGSLVFDGCNDSGTPLRMGIYIILLQAMNSSNMVAETIKSVVVVARRL